MRRNARSNYGQSLVELALAIPLLAIALIGLAQIGFLLYAHVQVTNASREAARAGSLFLNSRFHYTVAGSGSDCWHLRVWAENALVERQRESSGVRAGCPVSGGAVNPAIHALGLLNPAECASATDRDCWALQLAYENSTGAFVDVANSDSTPSSPPIPIAGKQIKAQLSYRYEMPFYATYIRIFPNPVVIEKTVIMKVQN